MKFIYREGLNRMVWNHTPQAIAADFRSGEFETDDPELIERLRVIGYDEAAPEPKPRRKRAK